MTETAKLLDLAHRVVEYAHMNIEGEIQFSEPFIACRGRVKGHTDPMFPEWSSFLVLRNDGCRVWQKAGWSGTPQVGERFTLNIHETHGVRGSAQKYFVAICADGRTMQSAERKLERVIRKTLKEPA